MAHLLKSIEFARDIVENFTMSLNLQILNGSRGGELLNLEESATVGRNAHISLDDPKMSKIHALFDYDPQLGWLVRDAGSKNGILVNGRRAQTHLLTEGDTIEVGTTQFRVASVSAFWKSHLNQILIDALDGSRNEPLRLEPFRTIPVLNFVQGIQTGTRLILEYGPREVGGESQDIQIFEPQCPDLAFTLTPHPKGALFETSYTQLVKLNEKSTAKKILQKGDRIYIHNTIIEVEFMNL